MTTSSQFSAPAKPFSEPAGGSEAAAVSRSSGPPPDHSPGEATTELVLTIAVLGGQPTASDVSEVGRVTNRLVSITGFDLTGPITAERLQEISAEIRSPFVVLTDTRHPVDLRAVLERTSLLMANPSAVLAYGPMSSALLPGAGIELPAEWTSPPSTPIGNPGSPAMIAGRNILIHMLAQAANVVGPPRNVVTRVSALRTRASMPVRPFAGSAWHLELWVRLLASGNVIYSPGVAAGPATTDDIAAAVVEEVAWWPSVIREARRLRVLDSVADFQASVQAYDRRYALLARSGLLGPALRRDTSDERSRILSESYDAPIRATSKLRVHAVVVGKGPAPFLDSLGEMVAKVSRLESSLPELLGPSSLEEALSSTSRLPARVVDASRHVDLPLLLLGTEESLDIRDIDQIRCLLPSLIELNQAGAVRVRGGWSRRLWPASMAGATQRSRPIYSLIINTGTDREWLPPPTPEQLVRNRASRRGFVITTPGYNHRSGGITALHRLCDLLNRVGGRCCLLPLGGDLRLLPPGQFFATNPEWHTPLATEPVDDDTVVIYPEVILGNPLGARNVVRWLLNRPGVITGQGMESGPDDLQVAFDSSFGPGKPLLRIPQVDPRTFFPSDVPGDVGLIWVYKGSVPTGLERGGLVEILSDWPADRDGLASLLRRATELLSCDWCTVLTHEAAMCGTPALLARDSHNQFSNSYMDGQPLGPEWLDLRPMLRPDGTEAGGATDGSAAVFHAYLDHVSMWAGELTDFISLATRHFDRVLSRVGAG